MKVLFLDMDGVLNSNAYFRSPSYAESRAMRAMGDDESYGDEWTSMVDNDLVKILNRVIRETGAKVVISSSWRYHRNPDEMQDILDRCGFKGEVIGRTPRALEIDPSSVGAPPMRMSQLYDRGYEILQWLVQNSHLNVADNFAIVDDQWEMTPVKDHFVRTSMACGITEEDADRLIAILNDDADTSTPTSDS